MLKNLVNHLNLETFQPTARARARAQSPEPRARAQSPSPSAAFYEVFSRVEVQNGLSSSSEPSLERKCPKFMILIEFTVPFGLERSFWTSTRAKCINLRILVTDTFFFKQKRNQHASQQTSLNINVLIITHFRNLLFFTINIVFSSFFSEASGY